MQNATPPKQRGCLFYGCITAIVLALAVLITGFFVYRYADRKLDEFVGEYTASAPMDLPKTAVSPEELRVLRERMDRFTAALDQGQEAQLILTADEVNALIENEPDLKPLHGKAHVFIEEDRIRSLVSYPLDGLPLKRFKGRYLNGIATWNVSLHRGVLRLRIDAVEVNDTPIPAEFIQLVRDENFAEAFARDSDNAAVLRKLDRIEVRDGRIFLKSAASSAAPVETQ